MPKVIISSETLGSGADIQLDSGEICMISVAQSGVLVYSYRPGFFSRLIAYSRGPRLYNEKSVYAAAKTAMAFAELFPEQRPELNFKNPVLAAFANAVWHCSSVAEVAIVLNEATKDAAR